LRTDQMAPIAQPLPRDRRLSVVAKMSPKPRGSTSDMVPLSPTTSTSSSASTPSRGSSTPVTPVGIGVPLLRRPSEQNPLEQVKSTEYGGDGLRRNSAPGRASSASVNEDDRVKVEILPSIPVASESVSQYQKQIADSHAFAQRGVDVLIAEDNPISQKILDTLLTRMGCRCVSVNDGAEALAAAMADIRFDVIILDLMMPNVTGEEVARMVRSTQNVNVETPMIAVTSYELKQANLGAGTIFSAILSKPLVKSELIACLAKLGFVLGSTAADGVDPHDRTRTMTASAKLQAM